MAISNPELQTFVDEVDSGLDATLDWRAEDSTLHILEMREEFDELRTKLKAYLTDPLNPGELMQLKDAIREVAQRVVYLTDQAQQEPF